MARGFCVGLGEFLTFSAMVLAILVNIGQLTNNVVSRNFYLANADLTGLQNAVATQAGGNAIPSGQIYASDQSSPLLEGNGLRQQYYWGMYTVCGGEGVSGARACSPNHFLTLFSPLEVFQADEGSNGAVDLNKVLPDGVVKNNSYLRRFSNAAIVLLLAGTIAAGLAFFVGFLAHRFAFLVSALLSLIAAATLLVSAAIWTALLAKSRGALMDANAGVMFHYGDALWMTWAAGGASLLAFVPLVLACCTGRNKYDY